MGRGGDKAADKVPTFTLEEVAQHNTKDDAWLVYRSRVFDFSSWGAHPGGQIIFTHAGRDATDVFNSFHPGSAHALLSRFYVGDLVTKDQGKDVTPFSKDMDVIRARARKMGLHKAKYVSEWCWRSLPAAAASVEWRRLRHSPAPTDALSPSLPGPAHQQPVVLRVQGRVEHPPVARRRGVLRLQQRLLRHGHRRRVLHRAVLAAERLAGARFPAPPGVRQARVR